MGSNWLKDSAVLGTPITGTAAAAAAPISAASVPCFGGLLQNTHASLTLLFGNATDQETILDAGASAQIPCTNATQIYVIDGTGSATFTFQPMIARIG